MDKYAEYLDDADEASGDSIKMMREAMAHTQVRQLCEPISIVSFSRGALGGDGRSWGRTQFVLSKIGIQCRTSYILSSTPKP